jgi:hypothetical protein
VETSDVSCEHLNQKQRADPMGIGPLPFKDWEQGSALVLIRLLAQPLGVRAAGSLLDFASLQGAGADVSADRSAVDKNADPLEVRLELALGLVVRVADVVAKSCGSAGDNAACHVLFTPGRSFLSARTRKLTDHPRPMQAKKINSERFPRP